MFSQAWKILDFGPLGHKIRPYKSEKNQFSRGWGKGLQIANKEKAAQGRNLMGG